jgi:hypothetical protein
MATVFLSGAARCRSAFRQEAGISSIRLPVSISAVAMMVSDPFSSILRVAPKEQS